MLLLILSYAPAVFPLTLTEKVQLVAFAERVAPLMVMVDEPALAVMV